jgi:hypothetical protein
MARRELITQTSGVPVSSLKAPRRFPAALGRFALLLSRILFRWRVHKSIETVKTLILLLYEAAIFHFLGWSRNLFGRWRHLLIIAVEAFFALIFNVKAGPQCL